MAIKPAAAIVLAAGLAACTTVEPSRPVSDTPQRQGIAGEWTLKAQDSIITCRIKIGPGQGRGQGTATDFGCIDLNGFAGFLRRWDRDDGRIFFYSFGRDGPVARMRRAGPDRFRGRLVPSGREIVMTRR